MSSSRCSDRTHGRPTWTSPCTHPSAVARAGPRHGYGRYRRRWTPDSPGLWWNVRTRSHPLLIRGSARLAPPVAPHPPPDGHARQEQVRGPPSRPVDDRTLTPRSDLHRRVSWLFAVLLEAATRDAPDRATPIYSGSSSGSNVSGSLRRRCRHLFQDSESHPEERAGRRPGQVDRR